MSEKSQIVENPLLLTELYKQGVFYISSEVSPSKTTTSPKDVAPIEPVAPAEKIEKPAKLEIPAASVICILRDAEPKHWPAKLAEPMTKILGNVKLNGAPLTLADYAVYNLALMPEVTDISVFFQSLNTSKIILWSDDIQIPGMQQRNSQYQMAEKEVLFLPNPLTVMLNQDSKMATWGALKKFFKMT